MPCANRAPAPPRPAPPRPPKLRCHTLGAPSPSPRLASLWRISCPSRDGLQTTPLHLRGMPWSSGPGPGPGSERCRVIARLNSQHVGRRRRPASMRGACRLVCGAPAAGGTRRRPAVARRPTWRRRPPASQGPLSAARTICHAPLLSTSMSPPDHQLALALSPLRLRQHIRS